MSGGLDDWWLLQIVLVLIYLMECVWWVSPQSVILERTRRGARFRWPLGDVTIRGRVPVLLNPLAPWRSCYVLEPLPVTVTADAVVLMPMQDPRRRPGPMPTTVPVLQWEDIAGIWHEDRRLFLGRTNVVICRSPALAEHVASRIRAIWKAEPEDRVRLLDQWNAERCDRHSVEAAFGSHAGNTRMLCVGGAAMFISLFVLLPLSIALDQRLVPQVFLFAGVGWLCVLVAYAHAAHHEVGRWRTLANMLFMPVSAVRAASHLTRDRLAIVEPAAVVLATDPAPDSSEVVGLILRDLVWSVRRGDAAIDGALDTARARTLRVLRQRFPSFEHHLAAPIRDAGCLAYCPRCHCQYVIAHGECCNCPGVPLQQWQGGGEGVNFGRFGGIIDEGIG